MKIYASDSYPDLYTMLVDAGLEDDIVGHHESTMYVRKTPEVDAVINDWREAGGIDNLSTFIDEIDHERCYDVPFGYTPFWDERLGASTAARGSKVMASDAVSPLVADGINAVQSAISALEHLIDEGALADFDSWNPTRDDESPEVMRMYSKATGFESKALNKVNGAIDDLRDTLDVLLAF